MRGFACKIHSSDSKIDITGFGTKQLDGCHMWSRNCLPFQSTWARHRVFTYLSRVNLAKCYVFTFLAPCCDVHYNFRVKTISRWVSHVKQELQTLLEHMRSPPGFYWVSCSSIFSFLCNVLLIVVCHKCFFFWPLCCLSFDLRLLITPLVSSGFSYRFPQY